MFESPQVQMQMMWTSGIGDQTRVRFNTRDAADVPERDVHLGVWRIPAAIANWLTPSRGGPSVLQAGIPRTDSAQALPDSLPSCC